jgi:Ca-activated chloride channel family protein
MNADSDNNQPAQVDDFADGLLDRALAEVVGGETPPDLSELILAGKRPSAQLVADRIIRRRLSRRALIALTIAAILLVAAVPLIVSSISSHNVALMQAAPVNVQDLATTTISPETWSRPTVDSASPISSGNASALPAPGFTPPGEPTAVLAGPRAPGGFAPPGSESQAAAGPQVPGGRSTLKALGAEGLLGPVDNRFIGGANIVIIRGREQDVERVQEAIKHLESKGRVLPGSMPDANEPPIAYPSAETWKALTDRRQDRYGTSEQSPPSSEGIPPSAIVDTTAPSGISDLPRFTSDLDVTFRSDSFEMAGKPTGAPLPQDGNGDGILAGGAVARGINGVGGGGANADFDDLTPLITGTVAGGKDLVALADGKHDRMYQFGDDRFDPDVLYWQGGRPEAPRPEKMTELGTGPGLSGDQYVRIVENPFIKADGGAAVSTFSIDVDTASYTNVRRFLLTENTLPPPDAVRIEELVNYFKYDYAPPVSPNDPIAYNTVMATQRAEAAAKGFPPFAAHLEVAGCPWKPEHRLVRIGIKGLEMDRRERPKSNLVFLVDVSGSMNEPNKLPLVVEGLKELARELSENDRVSIVVYAQQEGLVLPSTPGSQRETILAALDQLRAGGSTAGGAGIQLAYQIAQDHFIEGGTNRVILCTDGDFNVGVTSTAELQRLVEQKAKETKVFLSVLGFGRGNLNDQMMEAISNHGNGNYSYVDSLREARRVFVEEMSGTLVAIAKDVKIQVEFNPKQVAGYRLIGYENRMLRTEDFNDDKKDAGEIGAGHTVTALYEIVPAGRPVDLPPVDELKYQRPAVAASADSSPSGAEEAARISRELLTLKMKYKRPEADTSEDTLQWPLTDDGKAFSAASRDFQFAAAVTSFGMLLRNSEHKGNLTYAAALELAQGSVGNDEQGYRRELVEMIRRARQLRGE